MKKLLLALCLVPAVLAAQSRSKVSVSAPVKQVATAKTSPFKKRDVVSPVRVSSTSTSTMSRSSSMNRDKTSSWATQIGTTYYDLMTNGSLERRVILYSGGRVSATWTNSNDSSSTFPDRGTAYVHFNGTSWSKQNSSRLEPDRAGWPGLITFTDKDKSQREGIISHFASGNTSNIGGGTYWMKDSSIGSGNFGVFMSKDVPGGMLWPRVAVTGKYIHMIATYDDYRIRGGVINPDQYWRYNIETGKFDVDAVNLPGYDSTRYGQGSADEYSIDANGATVAILIGGGLNDLTLWKSNDSGNHWTKTIIDSFKYAPAQLRKDIPFDTTTTNDGSGTVMVDASGTAHVFYAPTRVLNDNANGIDTSYTYFIDNLGINYWNDKIGGKSTRITGVLDLDGDGALSIQPNTSSNTVASYGGNNLCTFPIGSVDANGNIYCVYSAPVETDVDAFTTVANYRHVYVVFSKDGGQTWGLPQDITQLVGHEYVFGTTARDADNYLHLTYMEDEEPGIFLVSSSPEALHQNRMMYEAVPIDQILNDSIGFQPTVGIHEAGAPAFEMVTLYPNPASSNIRISLRLNTAAETAIRLTDITGKTVYAQNAGRMTAGNVNIDVNISELPAGIYMCQVTAGNSISTQKLVIEK